VTSKPKTHFEQVPLEVVKRVAKVDDPKETSIRKELDVTPKKRAAESVGGPSPEGLQVMNSSFDIFQMESDGSVLWQGLAPNIEEAKQRVKELQVGSPAQYMVISLRTGGKLFIGSDYAGEQQGQTEAL
jgi:hypothetical protein